MSHTNDRDEIRIPTDQVDDDHDEEEEDEEEERPDDAVDCPQCDQWSPDPDCSLCDGRGWVDWEELLRRLEDPAWPFVPDGRAGMAHYLGTRSA